MGRDRVRVDPEQAPGPGSGRCGPSLACVMRAQRDGIRPRSILAIPPRTMRDEVTSPKRLPPGAGTRIAGRLGGLGPDRLPPPGAGTRRAVTSAPERASTTPLRAETRRRSGPGGRDSKNPCVVPRSPPGTYLSRVGAESLEGVVGTRRCECSGTRPSPLWERAASPPEAAFTKLLRAGPEGLSRYRLCILPLARGVQATRPCRSGFSPLARGAPGPLLGAGAGDQFSPPRAGSTRVGGGGAGPSAFSPPRAGSTHDGCGAG